MAHKEPCPKIPLVNTDRFVLCPGWHVKLLLSFALPVRDNSTASFTGSNDVSHISMTRAELKGGSWHFLHPPWLSMMPFLAHDNRGGNGQGGNSFLPMFKTFFAFNTLLLDTGYL